MYKRLICLTLVLSILLAGLPAGATDLELTRLTGRSAEVLTAEAISARPILEEAAPLNPNPGFLVNGDPVTIDLGIRMVGEVTYVSVRALTAVLYPDAKVEWVENRAVATDEGLCVIAIPGCRYLVANDRYLYVPDGIQLEGGVVLAPVRTLAKALGAGVIWTAESGINVVSGSGPIAPAAAFYGEEDLYWLSRIIFSESGNQPLDGKIAVGNVILNRMADSRFPNTVKGVIFDNRGGVYQFTPAQSGAINRNPNVESIIAAKLVLEGAVVLPGALYFNSTRSSSWASRNRAYITTIGGHNFYQ